MGRTRRSQRRRYAQIALGAIASLPPTSLAGGALYGVGDLPGGSFSSSVTDLSGDGRFVIGHSITDSSIHGTQLATLFRWSIAGGLEDQGFDAAGTSLGVIRGPSISHDGSVASGTFGSFTGFRHTFGGETRALPNSLLVGDMNPSGSVIVGAPRFNGNYFTRWRAANGYSAERITVAPSARYTLATGVSNDGTAASVYTEDGVTGTTYLWREGQAPVLAYSAPLASLPPAESLEISGDGSTIIGRTWRWSLSGGFEDLSNVIAPQSIAPDSRTLLGARNGRATILNASDQLVDVATSLEQDYGINLVGWQLIDIVGMSDDGTVWAGNGINPQGFREGWVAVIPEPTSAALSVLGLIALIRRR